MLMSLSLGPNTVRTLEQMGLGDEYNSVAETDDSGLFFQWWDGIKVHMGGEVSIRGMLLVAVLNWTPLIQTYTKYPRSAVHRARLLEVLHRSLPASVTVHLGVRVTGVKNLPTEGKARITYTASQPPPGSTPALPAGAALAHAPALPKEEHFDADVVVGADGIKSVLRGIMALPSPPEAGNTAGTPAVQRYTGTYCYRALIPMEKAMELDVPEQGIFAQKPKMVFGPGRHLTIFPIEKGKVGSHSDEIGHTLILVQVLNIVAFVSDRSKPKDQRTWDGPWLKKVDMETIQSDFDDWDEYPKKLLGVSHNPS